MLWHGYVSIKRFGENFPQEGWVTLIDAIRLIETVNGGEAQYLLQERPNLDTFDWITDDEETPEDETVVYSNGYIYEARFAADTITFENFKIEMAELFEVDPDDVTYTTHTETIRNNLSCFARYYYLDVHRMEIILFGNEDDESFCTRECSRIECEGYIDDNAIIWDRGA